MICGQGLFWGGEEAVLQTHAVGAGWEGTEQPSAPPNQHRGFLPPQMAQIFSFSHLFSNFFSFE